MRQVELIPGVAYITLRWSVTIARLGGATVARLTPVQKVACSNHVRVTSKDFPSGNGQAMNGGRVLYPFVRILSYLEAMSVSFDQVLLI